MLRSCNSTTAQDHQRGEGPTWDLPGFERLVHLGYMQVF